MPMFAVFSARRPLVLLVYVFLLGGALVLAACGDDARGGGNVAVGKIAETRPAAQQKKRVTPVVTPANAKPSVSHQSMRRPL